MKRVVTTDRNLQAIQDNAQSAINQPDSVPVMDITTDANGKQTVKRRTVGNPFSDGVIINIDLNASVDNLIQHGLGKVPTAWAVLRLWGHSADLWEVSSSNVKDKNGNNTSANENYLNLWCTYSCHVSLWVA